MLAMSREGLLIMAALVLILGICIGYIVCRVRTYHRVGSFIINYSNPEMDLVKLELDKDLDYIEKQHEIEFEVRIIR